ncbi:hypothetical protein ACFLVO_00005 [Chloroflexota bacterium]
MTIDEISDTSNKKSANSDPLDIFLSTRKAEILDSIGDETYMVISCSPASLRDETVLNTDDQKLRQIIARPPQIVKLVEGMANISCGVPYPTTNGLRADAPSAFDSGDYIEVYSTGYVEYGQQIKRSKNESLGLYFSSKYHTAHIVNFMRFIEEIYELYLSSAPLVIKFAIYNASGMWLATGEGDEKQVKWPEQHIELGKFYTENLSKERLLLTKTIGDRLWQVFSYEKSTLFDDNGVFEIG